MPLPKPPTDGNKESEKKFMEKCMHVMKQEKRPHEQSIAICMSMLKRAKKNAKGSEEDINWDDYANEPFIIVP
jgi:hypothetical protein